MIRIGFLFNFSPEWIGGYNYVRNLLYAISETPGIQIEPVVFVADDVDTESLCEISRYSTVIRVSLLRRRSLMWLLWRISRRLTGTDFFIDIVLRKHQINIFSHSDLLRTFSARVLNWIPDFQHFRLPEMFTSREIKSRNTAFRNSLDGADLVILSSEAARDDLHAFAPERVKKARVLRFIAQPELHRVGVQMELKTDILEKLSVRQPFFYLPNQFWKHKNHRIVFEALSILKRTGKNPCVVCSGRLSDYRNQGHIDQLKDFIRSNELNVKLLGLIPFEAVAVLMRNSLAVINPSLFEGWSTTVEECKSLGKRLILSDIPVHREQDPLNCIYFDPKDPHELAQIIEREMNSPSVECESVDLDFRTRSFAEQYQSIVFEALGIKHLHLTVGTNHHSDVKTQ